MCVCVRERDREREEKKRLCCGIIYTRLEKTALSWYQDVNPLTNDTTPSRTVPRIDFRLMVIKWVLKALGNDCCIIILLYQVFSNP